MFVVTYTHTRVNTEVPFFATAHEKLNNRVLRKLKKAKGFDSQTSEVSEDGLVNTVQVRWTFRHHWVTFEYVHKSLLDVYRHEQTKYEEQYGGSTTVDTAAACR